MFFDILQMPQYTLTVVKVPLNKPEPDLPPRFGKLGNLNLDLIENKKKLRANLPLKPLKSLRVQRPERTEPATPQKIDPVQHDSVSEKEFELPIKSAPKKVSPEDDIIAQLGAMSEKEDAASEVSEGGSEEFVRNMQDDASDLENDSDDNLSEDFEASESEFEPDGSDAEASEEEQEDPEETRQEYLMRFKLLKRSYPGHEFPVYTEHTDLKTLKRMYEDTFKMITLDTTVSNYRTWISAAFLGIEFAANKLGLDFTGFAKFQLSKMDKYERLLIELGERSYSQFANNWPVEIRLLGIILLDAGLFYLGKMASDIAGEGVGELLSSMFGLPQKAPTARAPKMRGPSITPDEIRSFSKHD